MGSFCVIITSMPVAPIAYLYLILVIASIFSIPLVVYYRNWEGLGVIVICILLFGIGFSANFQICPMFFCIGRD